MRSSVRVRLVSGIAVASVLAVGAWQAALAQSAQENPEGRPGRPARVRPGDGEGGQRGPNVEASMKGMNRALKQLTATVGDAAKKAETLKVVGDMQRACVNAKSQPAPADVLEKAADEAAKAKMSDAFHRGLLDILRTLVDIEQNVLDGKHDAAKKLADKLTKLRDDGHTALGVKDEEEQP